MSDTFSNKQPTISDDENMVYTMGGLDGLPTDAPATPTTQVEQPEAPSYLSRIMPDINFGDFIGSVGQLAQLFPGTQVKPSYQPGLTDLTFTRGYYGPQEDVMPTGFGTESAGTLFWSPQRYQLPAPTFQTQQPREQDDEERQRRENEAILQTALGMDWSGAYNDYLNRLEAENQDINISNVFTPTNVNYQTQSQSQRQSMGGGGSQYQEQDSDTDSDSTDNSGLLAALAAAGLTGAAVAGTTGGGGGGGGSTTTTTGGTKPGGGTTSTTTGGSKTGGGSATNDSQIIDFDIGTRDPGTTIDTDDDGTIVTGPTQADLEAKAAREQTVKGLYQNLFGRTDVDQEGLDYWTGQLASGKSSTDLLRDMVSGAQGSDVQAAQNTDTVTKLYQDLLGRTPDAEGLSYFRQQLSAGTTPDDVARNIISGARANEEASKISQEEYDRYFKQPETSAPTQDTSSPTSQNEQFVRDAYQSLFGRAADAEGLAYFTNELNSGASQVDIVNNMMAGAQGADLARVQEYQQSADDLKDALFYSIQNYGAGDTLDDQKANIVNALAENYPELFSDLVGNASGLGDFITAGNAIFSAETGGEAANNLVNAFGTSALSEAAAMALASQGFPVVGQVVGAAIVLDSLLSEALGYDSPIQDGIAWLGNATEDAVNWFSDVADDLFGGIGDFFGGLFAEGGLVDLPSETSYNYTDYYGGLGQMPQLSLDEVQPEMAFAGGGLIPLVGGGKVARGPGGGLDDLIPTSIDGRRAAALSDGEFVIPADVVSMMGDGSSNAGAKRLYDIVRQVRQEKTGTSKQAGPLPVGKILERTMK